MCTLELGVLSTSELFGLPVPCEYKGVADKFVATISPMRTWPKLDVFTLSFGPDEEPIVLRMENVWMATVSPCADYRAYRRAKAEAELADAEEKLLQQDDLDPKSKEKKQ